MSTLAEDRAIDETMAASRYRAEESPLLAWAFVWGVWALMTFMALRFVWRYGSPIPFWEEWLFVPYAVGETPISLSWVWEQYSEHRTPLHKLLICGAFSVFGLDERPVLLLDVGLLAALAAAMIWAVRRVRGRSSYADAFFPFVLLNLGHGETFYWAGTNVYVMMTFLVGMILVILHVTGSRFTARSAALTGGCLVPLPLIFGGGVVYAACLSCGLAYFGLGQIRSGDRDGRRAGRILLASAGLTLALVALYFVGYHRATLAIPTRSAEKGAVGVVKMTLRFLAEAFSWGGRDPFGRRMRWLMAGLVVIAVGCLAAALLRRPARERRPVLGLGLFLASSLVVALAVGWGRMPWGPASLDWSRYAVAAAPTLLCLYFVWEACGPRAVRSAGRAALCGLVFAFLAVNHLKGQELGRRHRADQEAFLKDVRAGKPIPYLVSRHAAATYYIHDRLEVFLRLLRDRRYGDYAKLPADPPLREVPLTCSPSSARGLTWDGERGRTTSDDPVIVFDLPRPTQLAGVRFKFAGTNPGGWNPLLAVAWRGRSAEHGQQWGTYEPLLLKAGGPAVDVPVWTYRTVDRITIRPDRRPGEFALSQLVLLMPERPWSPEEEEPPPDGEESQ